MTWEVSSSLACQPGVSSGGFSRRSERIPVAALGVRFVKTDPRARIVFQRSEDRVMIFIFEAWPFTIRIC
jgi:hypothetical protein